MLFSLDTKNTDALIGGVAKVLADEGITLGDSTRLLKPLVATEGVLTKRKPTSEEQRDIDYGRRIAHALSSVDIGQSVAISDKACVAVEAMEGTDAMLRRAASLVNGRPLRLIKASGRRRHLQFDVPVAGPATIATMAETGATALAIDAGRTLLLDRADLIAAADAKGITIVGYRAPGAQCLAQPPNRNRWRSASGVNRRLRTSIRTPRVSAVVRSTRSERVRFTRQPRLAPGVSRGVRSSARTNPLHSCPANRSTEASPHQAPRASPGTAQATRPWSPMPSAQPA